MDALDKAFCLEVRVAIPAQLNAILLNGPPQRGAWARVGRTARQTSVEARSSLPESSYKKHLLTEHCRHVL